MTPRISVALSTYNGARYLREQIDSVLAQEGVDLELVCVDDGSSDDTPAILAEYAARDPRVSWSANPRNLGPTASFERAMSLCRGEFIAPCDQDDYCEPGKLRTLLAAIGDADLAYCDSRYMDGDGRDLGCRVSGHMRMLEGRRPVEFLFGNSVSGHASLVRRSLFEQARPFPEGVYHDWWLALCAAALGQLLCHPSATVLYRQHGRNAAGGRWWMRASLDAALHPVRWWRGSLTAFSATVAQACALACRVERESPSGASLPTLRAYCRAFSTGTGALQRMRTVRRHGVRPRSSLGYPLFFYARVVLWPAGGPGPRGADR